MDTAKVKSIIEKQRDFYAAGTTMSIRWRIDQLKKLRDAVKKYEKQMTAALTKDLGRSETEGYFCDVGTVIAEVNEAIAHLRKWARTETHFSGLVCFPSLFTKVYKKPYGTVLIISPFNFPFMLTFGPLLAAISGGNTCVIKASSKSVACTKVLCELIAETFDPAFVTVLTGGHDVADACLDQRFDKIFYTGSPAVAKHIMACAAKNLTPVALELGGETGNWAVIRKDADIKDAANKIAFFKALNAGQICININQVAVAKDIAEDFIKELKKAFETQLGDAVSNDSYAHLITDAAYEKCVRDCEAYKDRIVFGGTGDKTTRRFSPTLIYPVDRDEEIVKRELFCPLLPVVVYEDEKAEELLEVIESREHPLAFYVFTKNTAWAKSVMKRLRFGGGCINEVCIQLMVKGVPFNGIGHSGMGAYHGEWGFREFTYPCTVLKGATHFNLPLRVQPYTDRKRKLIKMFEK